MDANGTGVDIPNLTFTGEFTLSGWVYLDPSDSYTSADTLVTATNASVNFNGGALTFSASGEGDLVTATAAAELGGWTHYAITREDDGFIRLYINGSLDNSSAVGAGNRTNATPWNDTVTFTQIAALNAAIDDFQIWNVARTAAEISRDLASCQLYGRSRRRFRHQ